MKVTLLIPTMNEVEGMKAIMPQIDPSWCHQILVVDNSTDGTAEWAEAQGYQVVRQQKKGIRNAYIEAWPHITGEWVITFSPDGNSIPDLIPQLIQAVQQDGGYDMVIASRYKGEAKSDDDDVVTGFGNWLFNRVIRMHGYRYTDCMVMYRIYRKAMFYELGLEKDESYWQERLFFTVLGCEPLLSIRAAKMKKKIGEIPGDEPERIGSERKLQVVRWGAGYMLQMFTELFSGHYRA